MAYYRKSFRFCKERDTSRKETGNFGAAVQEPEKRKIDPSKESFETWRRIAQLDTLCSSSLERGNRLEQEIYFCQDRAHELETQLQLNGNKV